MKSRFLLQPQRKDWTNNVHHNQRLIFVFFSLWFRIQTWHFCFRFCCTRFVETKRKLRQRFKVIETDRTSVADSLGTKTRATKPLQRSVATLVEQPSSNYYEQPTIERCPDNAQCNNSIHQSDRASATTAQRKQSQQWTATKKKRSEQKQIALLRCEPHRQHAGVDLATKRNEWKTLALCFAISFGFTLYRLFIFHISRTVSAPTVREVKADRAILGENECDEWPLVQQRLLNVSAQFERSVSTGIRKRFGFAWQDDK